MPADIYTSSLVPIMALDCDDAEARQDSKPPRELRREVTLPAVALLGDGSLASVTVLDLSYNGCRIESALGLLPGVHFTLSVLGLGKMPAYVRWCTNGFAGLSFRPEPIELAAETPRQHERISLKAEVLLRRAGQQKFLVQARDLSPSGCRVEFVERPSVGERHWVKLDGLEALEAEVRWVAGLSSGLKFVRPIYPPVFELLLARLR